MESTLPYSWYTDPDVLRREQERIFRGAWQYVGHLGQLPEPGTFFTAKAGRIPIVVTRAKDGEVRAFRNVCRHRGFQVADGEGKRETLQCPYHAWTYGLDGRLLGAPHMEEVPHFRKEDYPLHRVHTALHQRIRTPDPARPRYLLTEPGAGYRLVDPATTAGTERS